MGVAHGIITARRLWPIPSVTPDYDKIKVASYFRIFGQIEPQATKAPLLNLMRWLPLVVPPSQ